MEPNRLDGMRYLAGNLRKEGQVSRADAVLALVAEVERLQGLLGNVGGGLILGILVKEEANLDRCMCSSYCGDTSPAIIDADLSAESIEELVERAAGRVPIHIGRSREDAEPRLYVVGRDLTEELRITMQTKVAAAKDAHAAKQKAQAEMARAAAVARAQARVQELSSGAALEAAKAELEVLLANG